MFALSFLSGAWSAVAGAAGKFFDFVKTSPPMQYLIVGLIALFTVRSVVENTKRDVAKTVRKEERSAIKNEIIKANEDAREKVKQAGDAVTRDLESNSLRELTRNDPNRGGRPRRD